MSAYPWSYAEYLTEQRMMTYPVSVTRLTLAITDLNISEGLSFNLAQKYRFKKVLALAINVSKDYQPPNRMITPKYILDIIHDQNM